MSLRKVMNPKRGMSLRETLKELVNDNTHMRDQIAWLMAQREVLMTVAKDARIWNL